MNNKQAYRILSKVYPLLELKKHDYNNDPDKDHLFYDLPVFRDAYEKVKLFAPYLITPLIRRILEPIENSTREYYPTDKASAEALINASVDLMSSVIRFINFVGPKEFTEATEESLDVELKHIDSLEELEKAANLLRRSFNTPVLEIGGQVTVEKVDSGSVWITLGIIGAAGMALKLCANLIWAAVAIQNKAREGKVFIEHARTLEIKNDYLEMLIEAERKKIQLIEEGEAQHIISMYMADKDSPNLNNNMRGSIEAIGALIEKGAQFYPSIKASDEIKPLFPDFSIKELLESKTKLLSEGGQKAE
ncbi:hypothetical protein [Spirosoma agri]|uniref:Uncharacterized protein n=1 Tax=Spirosoma agri TaxID=1987381 RepID=A0A6M0ILI2_9BACT|nr:hypothetical protein [Spirosoma agri]NEU68261.1 hypothetical protein [Spirosoma agri]